MTPATAESILNATIDLYREQGFNGTSIKQIVSASETTTGSVYHFFPDGKEQLTIEAMKLSGPGYQAIIENILDEAEDLPSGIQAVCEQAAHTLAQSDYLDPCPIGGVAREVANTKPGIRAVIAEVFDGWSGAIASRLVAAGVGEAMARDISTHFIAAIEGSFTMARTYRSADPLLSVGRLTSALVAAEIRGE